MVGSPDPLALLGEGNGRDGKHNRRSDDIVCGGCLACFQKLLHKIALRQAQKKTPRPAHKSIAEAFSSSISIRVAGRPGEIEEVDRPILHMRIEEPKTKSRAAKHQAAKLEPRDLVSVVKLAFEGLRRQSALWPFSQQTLRKRLYAVLERLGLDKSFGREKALDLGSFRPGGATFLLQTCEDSELVRRRGRWVSPKVMEIHLQEIAASTFLGDLPPHVREKVQAAASAFTDTLEKAKVLSAAGVPARAWPYLWPNF